VVHYPLITLDFFSRMMLDLARGRFGIDALRRCTAMFSQSKACNLCYLFEFHLAFLLPPSVWLGSDTDCTTMTTFWCLVVWFIASFLHIPSYRQQHSFRPRQCNRPIASRFEFAFMVIDFSGNPTDSVWCLFRHTRSWQLVCVCICVRMFFLPALVSVGLGVCVCH